MTAYLIALVNLKDPQLMQEYGAAAGPTILAAGGKIVGRGKLKGLAGNLPAQVGLIAEFESQAALDAWYNGPDYQALIGLRDRAMEPTFFALEVPA